MRNIFLAIFLALAGCATQGALSDQEVEHIEQQSEEINTSLNLWLDTWDTRMSTYMTTKTNTPIVATHSNWIVFDRVAATVNIRFTDENSYLDGYMFVIRQNGEWKMVGVTFTSKTEL